MIIEQYPKFIASLCLWREARGCSRDEKAAVMWVLLNRSADVAHFPLHNRKATVPSGQRLTTVILDPWQFSSFNANDPNAVKMPIPTGGEWEDFVECCEVVESPGVADPTGGAQYYHSFQKREQFPKWADESKLTLRTKHFSFYRL